MGSRRGRNCRGATGDLVKEGFLSDRVCHAQPYPPSPLYLRIPMYAHRKHTGATKVHSGFITQMKGNLPQSLILSPEGRSKIMFFLHIRKLDTLID